MAGAGVASRALAETGSGFDLELGECPSGWGSDEHADKAAIMAKIKGAQEMPFTAAE
jgi:hypothetical protein